MEKKSQGTAYITKSNFNKIVRGLDISITKGSKNDLYKSNISHILSVKEINLLYIVMEVYKGFEIESYKPIPP
ncbi:hypothetical protein, partial [Oceanisphaera marina]|uniref:hypothetical protein n=1 Tax=Oceanisphaera marina TaxID=2017550 RepID=UPI001E6436B6